MRFAVTALFAAILLNAAIFAQNPRSVITGIVMDPEDAVIRAATVEAVNLETNIRYRAETTSTGNYTFANLPPGRYEISTTVGKFKPYVRKDVMASAAQTARIDIHLEATATESEALRAAEVEEIEPQRAESSQIIQSVESGTLDSLPLLAFPAGEGRIRNPFYALQLVPGTLMSNLQYFRVNGAPSNTQSIRVDGQEASNGLMLSRTIQNQVGVDAVEEFSVQTSNYAAEFGQAGGGFINIATKSGGSAYHGSAYDYWAHEVLNASQPYLNVTPQNRRNDYGFTLGGPLSVPKFYSVRDKTFFFFSFEQFRQDYIYENAFAMPTLAYRNGDFREALTGRKLGTDVLGRSIMEGMIYDPATERIAYGKRVRDPFPSNIIPKGRFDAVALKIQSLIPTPTDTDNSHITDNYAVPWESPRRDNILSFKVDHNMARSRLSVYYGLNAASATQSLDQGGDGITTAITSSKPADARSDTLRANYEYTVSPTLVANLGLGYQGMRYRQNSAYGSFDQKNLFGLTGAKYSSFPYITGLGAAMGGMKDMGANMQGLSKMVKPGGNAGLTWVRGNHFYKFGAELRIEGYPATVEYPAYGYLNFSAEQTALPSTLGQNLEGGTVGFPYASFLLGLVNNGDIGVVSNPRLGKHGWAVFAQDSWKLTPRLTFEYGLRYDYQTYLRDTYGRIGSFSPAATNPSAGNIPGAMIYEGYGRGRCNCDFAKVYPYAFGPRLGLAYQMTPKIVVRTGVGMMYGQTASENGTTLNSGSTHPFFSTTYAGSAMQLKNGFPSAGKWPDYSAGLTLVGSDTSPIAIDGNAGRPPRQIQWSIGVQSEIVRGTVLEIAYVGNRGAWWEANGLININALSTGRLESLGLDVEDSADRLLLSSTINSSLAVQRGFSKLPYSSFPLTQTVAQSLRPFPQFGDIVYRWAPLGKTWYDSVQLKLNKRYSYGLDLSAGFTWQREFASGNENIGSDTPLETVNNVFDPEANKHISALSRPFTGFIAPNYTFPRMAGNKLLSKVLRDWKVSAILQYASGLPIRVPISNSNLYSLVFQKTYANRVAGKSLYTKSLSSDDIDPMKEFALNAEAWTDPAAGRFSTSSVYYNDYRFRRRPSEQFSFGRMFRFNERLQLSVRADFQNIFNRVEMADPAYENAGATQVKDDDGVPQSGFGYINYKAVGGNPRNGMIVVRLQF